VAGGGGNYGGINSVSWSPDPTVLALGVGNGNVVVLSYVDGSLTTTATFSGDGTPINSVAWAPGDRVLAAGAADGTVRLWRVRAE
jgi:WD40 repeat protein